jgi:nifR3 family TIM-barrel protein
MKNFWGKLNKPIFCLAPMADVTDAAFRFLIAKYGKPDVMWTEFVSADGLCSAGEKNLLIDLEYSEKERPIVAQIFGATPENFYTAAKLIKKLGFDGIDINMGCPDKSIEKQGAGAALIKNFSLAQEIILATKKGSGGLPVSIKTRIGYNTNIIEEWTQTLLQTKPAAITLHLRTRKEMSKVPARWEEIIKAVALAKGTGTFILGNGDVENLAQAQEKVEQYGVDGVMIGRGIFGNPWLFRPHPSPPLIKGRGTTGAFSSPLPRGRLGGGLEEKLNVLLEHAKLFEKKFKGKKSFLIMRKHMSAYIKGYDNIKTLRIALMQTTNAKEVGQAVKKFLG